MCIYMLHIYTYVHSPILNYVYIIYVYHYVFIYIYIYILFPKAKGGGRGLDEKSGGRHHRRRWRACYHLRDNFTRLARD